MYLPGGVGEVDLMMYMHMYLQFTKLHVYLSV